jgi:hypothetical protein
MIVADFSTKIASAPTFASSSSAGAHSQIQTGTEASRKRYRPKQYGSPVWQPNAEPEHPVTSGFRTRII